MRITFGLSPEQWRSSFQLQLHPQAVDILAPGLTAKLVYDEFPNLENSATTPVHPQLGCNPTDVTGKLAY